MVILPSTADGTANRFQTINFVVSHRCNIKCRSCINGDAQHSRLRLSDERMAQVITEAAKLGGIRAIHFSGGEPFLYYDTITSASRLAHERYGWSSAATTSGYWAKSKEVAFEKLAALKSIGFRGLGVSIDEFHEEFLDLSRIRNLLLAAREIELTCRIQTAITRESRRVEHYRNELGVEAPDLFRWQNIPCIPLGYAETLDPATFYLQEGVPIGDCTIGTVITVFPDGAVSLCSTSRQCNALSVGNAYQRPLDEIIQDASGDPTFNALALWWGPRLVAEVLAENGIERYSKGSYAHVCHSCYKIMEDPEAVRTFRDALQPLSGELCVARQEQQATLDRLQLNRPWVVKRKK